VVRLAIPLTKDRIAWVDENDFDRVMQFKWIAWTKRGLWYAHSNLVGYMHCFILGRTGIDHKDRNGLNNVRDNLRDATTQQNGRNRSFTNSNHYKGVKRNGKKFGARIQIDVGQSLWLGSATDPVTAAKMYDEAAIKHFGEFANLNFPKEVSHR